jgi:hypothetical protein
MRIPCNFIRKELRRDKAKQPRVLGPVHDTHASRIQILDLRTHASRETPGTEGFCTPQWSPDGRQICALSRAKDRLLLFDLQTRKRTELAKTKPGASNVVWSSSGSYIYFLGTPLSAQAEGIVSDRKLEEVVGLKDFHQATAWRSWTGLEPGDSPLLVRDIGATEIYPRLGNAVTRGPHLLPRRSDCFRDRSEAKWGHWRGF